LAIYGWDQILGFEILLKPNAQGFVELSVNASFCLFTKHLPNLNEQNSIREGAASERLAEAVGAAMRAHRGAAA